MTWGSNRLNEFSLAARVAVEDARALAYFITCWRVAARLKAGDPGGAERMRAELESKRAATR